MTSGPRPPQGGGAHSRRDIASARATTSRLGVDPDRHTWLAYLPLAHIGGLSVVTSRPDLRHPSGGDRGLRIRACRDTGRLRGGDALSLVATALGRIDPSVFTLVLLGGGRPPDPLPPNAVTTYGLTETGSGLVYDGLPLSGVEPALRPFDLSTGNPADTGAAEILVRAPMLFRGYRDGSNSRVQGPDGGTDWFATGDAGLRTTRAASGVWSYRRCHQHWSREGLAGHGRAGTPDAPRHRRRRRLEAADPVWGDPRCLGVAADGVPNLEDLRRMTSEAIAPWAAPKEPSSSPASPGRPVARSGAMRSRR